MRTMVNIVIKQLLTKYLGNNVVHNRGTLRTVSYNSIIGSCDVKQTFDTF